MNSRTSVNALMMLLWFCILQNNKALCQLQYSLTDLGTLGGSSSEAFSVNNAGQVVGWTDLSNSNSDRHAFLYTSGSMADLGTFGGFLSVAFDINDVGQIVGFALPPTGNQRAFLYSGGTISDLGILPGTVGSGATGINDSGQVIGYSNSGNGTPHAFVYSGGAMNDLGILPDMTSSQATGINKGGQIVGYGQFSNNSQHSYLYTSGTMTDLSSILGVNSLATGISNSGQIVGVNTASHAFIYSNGKVTDLGALPNKLFSGATAVNSSGQVVGYSFNGSNDQRGFVYVNGKMLDLSSHISAGTGTVYQANAINDFGQIAANVIVNGGEHAALLTPTLLITATSRQPVVTLTTKQTVSNTQLEVFSNGQFVSGGSIDTTKPTIVLTHGWINPLETAQEVQQWTTDMATAIMQQAQANPTKPIPNIVAWNWANDASQFSPGIAEARTPNEGNALGLALGNLLGSNYTNSVQFYGHSLGTLVNAQAINKFNSLVSGAQIQDTLFDDAELAGLISSSNNWVSPIPKSGAVALIDNYISSAGNSHPEATNILLDKPASLGYIAFHGYPMDWYKPTVSGTTIGGLSAPANAGFGISIINNPSILTTGSFAGTYFESGTNGSLRQIDALTDDLLIGARRADELAGLGIYSDIGTVTADSITAAVQTAGHANVTLGLGLGVAVQLIKHSPSYVWLPITIPAGAQTMLADFQFSNLSSGDWLSIGVNNTPLFQLEDQFAGDNQDTTTPLDVSQWAGQNVELFLGLNNVDDNNAGGSITVSDIHFQGVPEPSTWALISIGISALALKRKTHKA